MVLPRIREPRSAPVMGTDAHLPPLGPKALTAQALRLRLSSTSGFVPEHHGDGRLNLGRAATAASVLVPLVLRDDGLHVLLTQRSAKLRDHAGQISFPGGRAEAFDVDAVATALRETEEEIGLARMHVEVIGSMPPYTTVTSYVVTPVVALVHPPFVLTLDAFEVDEAFEVPLQFLMTPAHHQRHRVHIEGSEREFLSMPWAPPGTTKEHFIWGATAAMLRNLYWLLAPRQDGVS